MAISDNEPIQRNSEGDVIQPKPYLASPGTREVNRSMGGFESFGSKDSGRTGLTIDQLSKLANTPTNQSSFSSPVHAIPQSELLENKRYESYGRGVDLENIYGLQQSWADQLANGVVKMAGVGVGTFLQSFATIPNTISALKNGKLSDLSGGNDGYESSIDTWVKNIEDYFPNYMTRREKEHPLLGLIPFAPGSANFWGDKIIKNLGFTAGAIGGAVVQDLAIGAVTGGLGEIPGVAAQVGKASLWLNKLFTGTNDLDKVLSLAAKVGKTEQQLFRYKQLGELAAATKVTDGFRYGMSIYGSARTEAAIEARDSYTKVRTDLIDQYKLDNFGQEPTGEVVSEIENYATDAMNTRFGINMALLTASNTIQFGNLFKSFSSASKGITGQVAKDLEDVGKIGLKEGSKDVFEKKTAETLAGRVWESVRPKVANVFTEGVYEEGGQFATEKGAYDYYTRKYKNLNDPNNKETWNSVNEIINSTTKGLKDQFGTSEGLENMIVGAVSALISGGIMGKVDQIKGRGKDARLQTAINTLNSYGLTGILSDGYGDTLDAAGIARDMESAVKSGNIYQYKNLKHDMFFNFVQSRIPSGMHDVTVEQLNMLKDLDKEEFEKSFGMDFNSSNKKNVNDYVDGLIYQANDIKKTYDSISTTFKNPFASSINPKTPEEAISNQNYGIFENWKKELTYLAAVAPDTNSRLESIQQSVSEINPLVTNDLLSTLSNDESLRNLSKSYEEKANQLNKTITEYTSAEDKKSTKQQVKALRTASERIQLGLVNGFDVKSFDYLLNFELNNQDPSKERVVRPESISQLSDYGYDIERLKYRKERSSELFDLLSDEAGFKKFFDTADQISSQEPPEEKPEQLLLPAATPQFKNKVGETEAVVAGKEYTIPASKKASVDKLSDDRWQVTAPDGAITFHDSKKKADDEAADINEEFGNLEKVKVIAVNDDGTLKVEDLNGDIYNIYPSKLDGYERIETEQEKLQKFAEDIESEQKEIELKSGDVATRDLETDISASEPFIKRKPRRWLYTSTTAMSESKPELLTPHALRAIAFRNDAKSFSNRGDLRIILVTQNQEKALGLDGLANLSMRSVADHTNLDNGFVGAVYVEQGTDGLYFVDEKGDRIGKVGDGTQIDLNKVVFDTMPDTDIRWDTGGKRYREEEMSEEEALAEADSWRAERKTIFEQSAQSPKIFSFVISRGIPSITDAYQRNAVGKTLIDEDLISSQEGLIVIPTTGTISHQGEIINFPNGRPVFQYGDTLQFLNNKKFNKNQAEAIFEVMNQMAKGIKKQADAGKKIKIDRDYTDFLQKVLYLRKSSDTSGNQFYIDTATMELFFNGERYDITNLEESKEDITDRLQKVYNNVNNFALTKEFNSPFTEYYMDGKELKTREWTNYQSYLLSSKDPDGKARPASEIPLTTAVTEKSDLKPYNYEQKYSILEGLELPQVNVAPAKVVEAAPVVVTPEAPAAEVVAPVSDEQKVIDFIGKRIQLSLPAGTVGDGSPQTYEGLNAGKVTYTVTPGGQVAIDGSIATNLATIKNVINTPASMAAINAALAPKEEEEKKEEAPKEEVKPVAPVVPPVTEAAKTYWESSTPESIKEELIADPQKSITSNVDEPGLTISFGYYQNEDRIDQVLIPGYEGADEVDIIEMPKGNYFSVENGFGESETFHEGDPKLNERIKSVIDYNKQSEKPSTPPVGKKNFGKAKRNRNSEYRRVGRTEKTSNKITDLDLQILKDWHAANVPNLPYEVLENIVLTHDGERAYGVFEDGIAKFYKGAIRGTEYHEVFEGIWKAFLNSEQRQAILDEFKAKDGTFIDRETGKKIAYAKATNQQAKERIADDFSDFRLGKMPARSLGAKILKFFRDIIEFVKKFISKPSLKTQLFNDINTGKFKDKTVPTKVKNALAEYKKIGNLSEEQANEFVQDITANWFQIVFGENRSLYDINRLSSTDVFGQIKEMYEEDGFIDNNDSDVLSESEFAELVARSKEFLRTFKINFREDDSISVNEEGADRNEYARETFNTDWKKYSPFAIKILMGTMVERESNNTVNEGFSLPKAKTTSDGLLKLLNFSRTFATAMDKFTNTTSASKLVDKLKTLAKEDNNYVALFKRLGGNVTTGQIEFGDFKGHDWRLFVNFYQTFTKQKPDALIQYISDNSDVYTSPANLFTTISKTKQSWIENMKGLSKAEDSVISYDYVNKVYKVKDVSKLPIKSTQNKLDFLAKLGITFPIDAYGRLKSTAENDQKKEFNDAISSLRSYLGTDETELMSLSGEVLGVNGPLNTIAELLVKVTNPNQDMTYFGIDKKRIQSYADSNALSVIEDEFNSADTLDDFLNNLRPELKDIFSTNSQVLKKGGLFFNKAGKRIKKLKVAYIQGTSVVATNKDTSTSKLSLGNRFVQEMNQNINGNYYVLVPADSSTEWMMNLGNIIKFSSVESGKADDQIHEIFRGYLEDDIALAMANRTALRNVANRARELRFFKDILPEKMLLEINALVINRATKDEITAYLNKNEGAINTAVDSYIETLNAGTLRILQENNQVYFHPAKDEKKEDVYSFIRLDNDFLVKEKLDRLNLTKDELDSIIKFTNVNYVINNIEYHKILFGDPYQFAVKDGQLDETKRIKSFLSPRRRMFDTPEFNTFLNQKMNMAGEIKLAAPDPSKNEFGDPGYHTHKSYTNTVTLNDVEIVGSIATLKNIPKEIQDKFAKKAKETDGASWIMDTTYKEVKMKNGQWDFEGNDEKWHQWQMAYTRQNMPGYEYTNQTLKEQDAKLVAKPMPKFMIDVLKPIVSGNRKNATGIELVLDKFSQMPLYFSMVQGTNLEKMYIKMWKEQRGYAVVLSGRKAGAGELHNIYNSDASFNEAPFNNLVEVPWSSYGLQVENAYDGEKEQTRGSQITKLASVDLFDNGVPVSEGAKKEYDRNMRLLKLMHENGYKSLLKKLGIQDLGTSFSLPDNIAVAKTLEYELLRRELSTNAKDTVQLNKNKQFAIPFEASTAYTQIRDILFSMVDKAINSPKMSGAAHVQVPVTMWENAGNRELIIKEDDGSWKKLTSLQYDKLSDERKKKVVFTDTTLKFYTKEDPYCEILLPHWFKLKLSKTGKFKTEKDLINYLNLSEEGKSILRGIGFRIPTQSLSSVEVFRVKGFLPESMGYTVVVPSEIVTKAGSDFDIDKLNMYLKATYIDAFGDIKLIRYLDNEEKTKDFYANVFDEKMSKKILKKEELREAARIRIYGEEDTEGLVAKYSDILDSILGEYQDAGTYIDELDAQLDKLANETLRQELKDRFVDDMYKKSIENEYYDSLEKLITLPENFNRLISPVDDAGLKALSEEIDKLKGVDENKIPNRILDRNYMTSLRHAFITAKRWVGIAAVNITGQSLTQKSRVYIDPERFTNLSAWDQVLLGDGSIALNHNTVEIDGKKYVSISGIKTADGKQYISDRLSGYATAFVDVAKDPYIMKLIQSEAAVGTFMFLERIGAGKAGVFFMNQPIIVEYLKDLDSYGSKNLFSKGRILDIVDRYGGIADSEFDVNKLEDNIGSKDLNLPEQVGIFWEFLKYAKMAEQSFKLTQATNYDTTKFRSSGAMFRKQTRTENARNFNIFTSVDDILDNSFIGDQSALVARAFEGLGTILKLDQYQFRAIINKVLKPFANDDYMSADNYAKVENKIVAAFLDYIIQTKSELSSEISTLLVDAKTSAAAKLAKAKEDHPNMQIIRDLEVASSQRVDGPKSIQLSVNLKTGYDEDVYIGMMRELRDNPETNSLYKDIVKVAVLQGSYQSAISLKNIIPLEDYAAYVAPYIAPLIASPDVKAFADGYFQRNNFRDGDVFTVVNPKFFINKQPFERVEDVQPVIEDQFGNPIYQYSNVFAFPNIKVPGILEVKSVSRQILVLNETFNFSATQDDFIVVPRVVIDSKTGAKVDMVTGRTVTDSMLSGAKKKGNMLYKTVYGYQKVRHEDGTPVTFTSDYKGDEMINHVYKLINLYGDNPYTTEFYPDFRKSVLDNGTAKIDAEIPDRDIIDHFAPQLAEDIAKSVEKAVPSQPMEQAPKANKELFSFEKGIVQKSFRGKPLEFVDKIPTEKETVVAMSNNRKTGVISIDDKAMIQKFNDKAWTKPAKQLDGSFATPLSENEFSSWDDWFTFALIHEVKHDTILKEEGETTGQYEDRINQAALEDLRSNYVIPSKTKEFPDKQLDIKDEKCN